MNLKSCKKYFMKYYKICKKKIFFTLTFALCFNKSLTISTFPFDIDQYNAVI